MKRETLRHPKTYDLASRLHCSRPEALGYLTLLWDFTAEVAPQGNIGKWPNGSIAGACDWHGDADEFVASLVDSGWLDQDEQHRLLVHDIAEHAERWWKLKLQKMGKDFLLPSIEASIERPTEGTTEPSTSRDLTYPNQTEPQATNVALPETCEDAGSATPDPVVLELPCDGNPKKWRLRKSHVERYRELYPSLDVEGECRKALAWVEGKPARRKTHNGMKAFLTGWMNRTQNRGHPETAANGRDANVTTESPYE